MPFNLSDDEFDLPADLRALGDRLSQESQHLAQVYPAGAMHDSLARAYGAAADFPDFPASPVSAPQKTNARSRGFAIAAATGLAVLLAVGLLLAGLARHTPEHPSVVQLATVRPSLNVISPGDAPSHVSPAAVPAKTRFAGSQSAVVAQPVWASPWETAAPQPAVLLNASGPQLEGLFDLWERESTQVATVSF